MLKLVGICKSIGSRISWFEPSFASLSFSSFPWVPMWPLTQEKVVFANLHFSRNTAFLKRAALSIFIHPRTSQFCRCSVSPSITYLKSEMISRGQKWGTFCITIMTAASSPVWLDCLLLGTLKAVFLGSFGPNQMPPPHLALSFPLFMQALSV